MFAAFLQMTSEMSFDYLNQASTCLADSRFAARSERPLAQFRTEEAGMLARHYCAFVALYARDASEWPGSEKPRTGDTFHCKFIGRDISLQT
jgi:hypothetical protein